MSAARPNNIVPVVIVLGDRTGLILWAPFWRAPSGEDEEGLLGRGDTVLAFPSAVELARHLAAHPESDLSSHPFWASTQRLPAEQLRAQPHDVVEFDEVFALLAGDFTAAARDRIAQCLQLAVSIAECCGDEVLMETLERAPYQRGLHAPSELASTLNWEELSDEVEVSWEWILDRLDGHIEWIGDCEHVDLADVQLGPAYASPWTSTRSPDEALELAYQAELPSRAATILVTLFFGFFGAIPAALATGAARDLGVPSFRYWAAFWWTLIIPLAASGTVAAVVLGSIGRST